MVTDAGSLDVFVEESFVLIVRRYFVTIAVFLVQADPPALAVGEIILDPHGNNRTAPIRAKA